MCVTDDHAIEVPRLTLPNTLIVIPCSSTKRRSGKHSTVSAPGISILDSLSRHLAAELSAQRAENAPTARIDQTILLPAAKRYTGHLYQRAGASFDALLQSGAHILIISGGYGVVLAAEAVGWYQQRFRAPMWPNGLVGRCVAEFAHSVKATTVVGLFAATTQYAKVLRNTSWPKSVVQVFQVSPERTTGAMRKAPRAQGEALATISRDHRLRSDWTSSDGLRMRVTKLS